MPVRSCGHHSDSCVQATGKLDLKEPIYRQLSAWYPPQSPEQPADQYDMRPDAHAAAAYNNPAQLADPEAPYEAQQVQPNGVLPGTSSGHEGGAVCHQVSSPGAGVGVVSQQHGMTTQQLMSQQPWGSSPGAQEPSFGGDNRERTL